MIYNENDQYAKKVSFNLREFKFVKGRFLHFAETTFCDYTSLPSDALWGSFVETDECVTNEPQRTCCGEANFRHFSFREVYK